MATTNLEIAQGTTQTVVINNVKDANGVLINPSGMSARAQIRADKEAGTVLYEWTSPGTITIATGKVTLLLTPAVTSAWAFASGVYDVELTDGSSQVSRIAEGFITINREVTR